MERKKMIYKSRYGNVDFWDPYPRLNEFKKIGINLSGGADSSLVMFMTCRELEARKSDATIIPITGVHNARPTNIWNAEEIVQLFKEMFPSVNIGEHEVDYYDKNHEKDKVNHHRAHEDRLRDNGTIEVLFHGRTANPTKAEAEKHNLMYKREERRDRHGHDRVPYHEHHGKPFYCPFEFVDKRFVATQYKKFNLMDNLFPLTASCVEYAEKTDYFTKPCKECWWCREKKWAFDMYDGGVM
tara:strand:- start:799 stop:1521 length:723 start_codon:yes stop_codon:yes gene_type:complete